MILNQQSLFYNLLVLIIKDEGYLPSFFDEYVNGKYDYLSKRKHPYKEEFIYKLNFKGMWFMTAYMEINYKNSGFMFDGRTYNSLNEWKLSHNLYIQPI